MERDTSPATRILMAEDSDQDAELVLRELRRSGLKFDSRRVQTEPDFRRALNEFRPQLILSDYVMPGFSGIAALRICRETGIDTPFIFVSGTIGEDVAVEAMKAGADDYVMKTNLIRLGPTVVRALREAELRQASKAAEEALRASESLKSAIVHASLDCVVSIDHDGVIAEFNPAAERTFGFKREEALGKLMVDLIIPPRQRDAHRRGLARYREVGEAPILGKRLELRAVRADGTEFPIELAVTATRSQSKSLFTAFIRDLTERKRAEEEQRADQARLQESEARHRAMFEQAAVGIVHSSLTGQLLLVNPTFCKVSGHAQEAAAGLTIEDLVHPDDIHWCIDGRAQILAGTMAIYEKELRMIRKDGAEHWVNVTTSLVRGADGQPAYFISIVNDISERKRAERDLQRFGRAMDVSPDSIYLTDPATMRFVYLNTTACRRLGYSREELLQKGPQDVFPTTRETISREFEAVIAAGEPGLIHERLFLRGDGSSGWSELHRRALRTEGGTLIVTIGRDISERKRADSVLALEHGVSRKLADADSAGEGLQAAIRLVCESEGWDAGRYWRVDEAAGMLRFANEWSMPGADGSGVTEGSRDITFARGAGLAGKVWQTGEPLWVSNVVEDARVQRKDLVRASGMRGAFVLPVVAEGDIIGVLAFSSREIRQPDERLLAAVRVIGGQVGQFLRRMEANERIRRLSRVHAVLSGINALIVRVGDPNELFRETCRIAVEAGNFSAAWMGVLDRTAMEMVAAASHGMPDSYMETIRGSLSRVRSGGGGIAGEAIREKRAVISNDVANDPRVLIAKLTLAIGTRALAVLPCMVAGEVVAVLSLHARELGFFDDEEMTLLHELAGDIAFAIDHLEKAGRLDYLAYYDQLTGLANRTLFLERVGQSILAAQQADSKFALAILDIERLRTINDSLGRQAGDALIKLVAERLALAGGPAGVSRISADHFALVLGTVKGRSEASRIMAGALRKCFDAPFRVNDTEVRISAKAGVAQFPGDGTEAETLLRNAEAALRKGKEGGERITFHSAEMTARVAESLTLENELREAIEKEEFVLYYQPKVDLETRHIVGVEALIRWESPERGLVPPLHFIPLLEETGLILRVGAWALKRATRDHALWLRQGVRAPRIAVNVSAIQLRQRDFVQVVTEAIAGGADPTAIDIEITESLLMEDVAGNIEKLKALRELGMKISIDDFGTGYSSLGYLARLPVHVLKIDRSFIVAMMNNPDTMTLVSTIISLAHSLRLDVVAEGVEQEDQAKMLRLLRCDQMQGYLISKPVPMDALTPLLRQKDRKPG